MTFNPLLPVHLRDSSSNLHWLFRRASLFIVVVTFVLVILLQHILPKAPRLELAKNRWRRVIDTFENAIKAKQNEKLNNLIFLVIKTNIM